MKVDPKNILQIL